MTPSPARRAEAAMLLVAMSWGLSFPLIKGALGVVPPFTFLTLRFALALVLFLPWLVRSRIPGSAWKPGLLLAFLAAAAYYTQTLGLVYTSPARSAFISGLSVVLVPLGYPLIARRLPARWPVAGAMLAAAGLWFLTAPGGTGWNRGDSLTLICAASYAVYIVYLEVATRRAGYFPMLAVQLLVMGIVFVPGSLAEASPPPFRPALVLPVAVTAVIVVGSLYLQNRYQRDTTATRAAVLFAAEPVFAALFSYLITGETLVAAQWAGGALILGGILLAEKRRRGELPEPV